MATSKPLVPDTDDTVSSWETEKENCLLNFSEMRNLCTEDKDIEIDGIPQTTDLQDQLISKAGCETVQRNNLKTLPDEATVSLESRSCLDIEKIESCDLGDSMEKKSDNTIQTRAENEHTCTLVLPANICGGPEGTTVEEVDNLTRRTKQTCDATVTCEENCADKTKTFQNCDTQKKNGDTVVINVKSKPVVTLVRTKPENPELSQLPVLQKPEAVVIKSNTPVESVLRPLARELYDIGFSLISERVCRGLVHRLNAGKMPLSDTDRKQLCMLTTYESKLRARNQPISCPIQSCKCGFKSESAVVIAFHRQYGRTSDCNDAFKSCCLCSFSTANVRSFARHMKRRHNVKALMPLRAAQYQCPFCSCENKYKLHLDRHVPYCSKLFNLNINLSPCRMDCDLPIFAKGEVPAPKPLRITVPTFVSQKLGTSLGTSSSMVTLPMTGFLLTSSISHTLQPPVFQMGQAKGMGSYQPCILVSSLASSLQSNGTAFQFLVPQAQNKQQTGIIVPSSQASFMIQPNLVQNLPRSAVVPIITGNLPNLPMAKQASLSQVQQNRFASVSAPIASRPSILSSAARMTVLQLPPSKSEILQTQVNQQAQTLPQLPCRPVFTPFILRPPMSISPFALRPCFPADNSGKPAPTVSPFSNNTRKLGPTILYVEPSKAKDLTRPAFSGKFNASSKMNSEKPQNELVICEICDGFVKDRQSLFVHFQNAHQVSVNDSINLIPSHSCSMCGLLFFTIPGLLHHFQAKHSYCDIRVMRDLARCPLCASVDLKNVVQHMGTQHHATMILSRDFKYCGICLLNTGDVRLFVRHMLTVHSEIFANENILLASIAASINWNIGSSGSGAVTKNRTASVGAKANRKIHHKALNETVNNCGSFKRKRRIKCTRCISTFNSARALQRHSRAAHSGELESCPLCLQPVQIGPQFIAHVKRLHLRRCSVKVERVLDAKLTNVTNVKTVAKTVCITNSSHKEQNNLDFLKKRCVVRIARLNPEQLGIKSEKP